MPDVNNGVRDHGSARNRLLGRLPHSAHARLLPHLEYVPMKLGDVFLERDTPLEYAYFPIDGIASLIHELEHGETAEQAIVGREGFLGTVLVLGGEAIPSKAVVQSEGAAYRLNRNVLTTEFDRSLEFRDMLLRYVQNLLTQVAQTAVCNRHHSVQQQLCRWILLSIDRLPDNQLTMTHHLIATMLGVRREGVTAAAGWLRELGAISYTRGRIRVLDRALLEDLCCECYGVVEKASETLMNTPFRIAS